MNNIVPIQTERTFQLKLSGGVWTESQLISLRAEIDRTLSYGFTPVRTLIPRIVAAHFKLSESELYGRDRHERVALARHIAMFLFREMTDDSLEEIAKHFGDRHHGTVLYACNRIHDEIDTNPKTKWDVEGIRRAIFVQLKERPA